jgi:hypothetical protein
MDNKQAACSIIEKLQLANGNSCSGVVFYNHTQASVPNGTSTLPTGWCVMDTQQYCCSKKRSPIHEADAFVLFDDARCRYESIMLDRSGYLNTAVNRYILSEWGTFAC